MNVKITNKNGVKLLTENKYCNENINVVLDDSSNANLTPENIKKDVEILGVVGTCEEGSGSSTEAIEDAFITRTLEGDYVNDRVDRIRNGCFQYCKNLKSVSFQNATYIHDRAFMGCDNLESVNIPKVWNADDYAFYGCSSLTNIESTELTNIGVYAFYGCEKLKEFRPPINWVEDYAFGNCYELEKIDITKVQTIHSYAFSNCYNLKELTFKSLWEIEYGAFWNCHNLRKIVLDVPYNKNPVLNYGAFLGCYHLTGEIDETYNPNGDRDCLIYVNNYRVSEFKKMDGWRDYANQIMPSSFLNGDIYWLEGDYFRILYLNKDFASVSEETLTLTSGNAYVDVENETLYL